MTTHIVCKDMAGKPNSKRCNCKYVLFCKATLKTLSKAMEKCVRND